MKYKVAIIVLLGIIAGPQSLKAEVVDIVRQLPCEQVCQPVFPSQIGRPVMWGIPARSWGSQEYNALASRIDECRALHLQAGRRAESNQCVGLADYIRRQFELPRKGAEENDRKAQAIKELERQNRAVLEHEESVKKAEAEARRVQENAARLEKETRDRAALEREEIVRKAETEAREAQAKAAQIEGEERERKEAIAEREARAARQKQDAAATVKSEIANNERIEQAKRLKMEAEAREQTARARVQASEDAKAKAQSDKLAAASFDVRNFIRRNPGLLQQSSDEMLNTLRDFYSVKVTMEFCQKNSSVLSTGYFGNYGSQLAEVNRRTKLIEDVAVQFLDVPGGDLKTMTGQEGLSLGNVRVADMLQANKSDLMRACDEGLAQLSQMFDFNR